MKAKVALIIDFDDPPVLAERLTSEFEVIDITDGLPVGAAVEEITALITTSHIGVPDWVWESKVRVIGNFGVGYDGIDIERAAAAGIWVTNTPTVLNDAVAELTVGMMVMAVRQLPAAIDHLRAGKWEAGINVPLAGTLEGKRLGLLGMGGIGSEIAVRAAANKMEISYHCRTPKDVQWTYQADLVELARSADVLCCIVPGGAETANLINAEVLEALGPQGYLVNVARGSVVDEPALIKALEAGRIAGAALDVYAAEPQVPAELQKLPNVICLPHIGSATEVARQAMGELVLDNIHAVLADKEPLTPVNQPST